MSDIRCPALTAACRLVSVLGSEIAVVVICLLLIALCRKSGLYTSGVMIVSAALNNLIKVVAARPRPDLPRLADVSGWSFPSGHAMNNICLYITISLLIYNRWQNKRAAIAAGTLLCSFGVFIGLSRIYLGVHYFSDVTAGFVAGSAIAIVSWIICRERVCPFREKAD